MGRKQYRHENSMNIRFQMARIMVPQFAILTEQMPKENVNLNTELEFKYSPDTPSLLTIVRFKFNSDMASSPFLVLDVACEFTIHPEDWEGLKKEGPIDLPTSLMEILAVHTVGTARGILHCKTEDTPCFGLMIPPLNVRKMLEK